MGRRCSRRRCRRALAAALLTPSSTGCSSAGRARGLGPRGRTFESSHPDAGAQQSAELASAVADATREFAIRIPDEALEDLSRRLAATRWPPSVEWVGWDEGTDVGWLRELCTYWADEFDWRAQE